MGIERRREGNQYPDNLDDVLNEEQLFMMNKMEECKTIKKTYSYKPFKINDLQESVIIPLDIN